MPEHPTESCLIICEGQVFPSSQMFEQQAEICRRKGTETSEMAGRQRNSRINFNDTNEIQMMILQSQVALWVSQINSTVVPFNLGKIRKLLGL